MLATNNELGKLTGIVYLIVNNINSKVYVGSTIQTFYERYSRNWWKEERNAHFKNAIIKYGYQNFSIYIIDFNLEYQNMLIFEDTLIVLFNSIDSRYGYNKKRSGLNNSLSLETRQKISKSNTSDENEFIKQLLEIHGDKYYYSSVKYVSARQKIKIYCNNCKEFFYQQANHHLNGHGCSICNHKKSGQDRKKDFSIFISQSKERFGDKFICLDENYLNGRQKINFFCKECEKKFTQCPEVHLVSKYGCPYCAIKNSNASTKRSVIKIDPISNRIIEIYPSIAEARRKNHNKSDISECCRKKNISQGFKWQYAENPDSS